MKRLLFFLVLFCAMAGLSFASYSVIGGNGLPVWMTQDDSITMLYPGQLLNFKNEAVLEYDGSMAYGNLNASLGAGNLSVVFNRALSLSSGMPYMKVPVTGAMYGFDLAGMSSGAGLFYSDTLDSVAYGKLDFPVDKGGTKSASANTMIGANFGTTLKSGADLSIVVLDDISLDPEAKTYNPAGWLMDETKDSRNTFLVQLNGRMPVGAFTANLDGTGYFGSQNNLYKQYDATGTLIGKTLGTGDMKAFVVEAGLADVIKPVASVQFTIGALLGWVGNFSSSRDENLLGLVGTAQTSDNMLYVPVYVAAEAKLNDIFSIRTGGNMPVFQMEAQTDLEKDAAGVTTLKTSSNVYGSGNGSVMLGATAKLGDFKIDAAIDYLILLEGPFAISGNSNSLSYITGVTYAWK